MITRVRNTTDKRARQLSLTPRGEAMSKKLRPIALRAAKRLLSPLSPLERPEFMRLLRKITSMADPLDLAEPARPSSLRLNGIRIVIVGLSDGFGREITERIEAEGAQIVELPAPLTTNSNDAEAEFSDGLKEACRRMGKIDVLLNGGSIGSELLSPRNVEKAYGQIQEIAAARWTSMTRVLPHFLDNGSGRIINLAIMPNASVPLRLMPAMIAANASIVALTREFATDYRRNGIVANSISPRLERLTNPDGKDATVSTKLARVAAADVASTVSYLASPDARFVSASDLILG